MPRYRRYRTDRVTTTQAGHPRPALWTFAGRTVSGTEYTFAATDRNFAANHRWDFLVRVPDRKDERIEVRPLAAPPIKAWAGLERRSLTFTPARKARYRGSYYCQISLADPTASRTRDVIRAHQRPDLPRRFDDFDDRFRKKETVRATRGFDQDELIALVAADDYDSMIKLFFATKVWVLKERVLLD